MKKVLALAIVLFYLSGLGGCLPTPRSGDGRIVLTVSWQATPVKARSVDEIRTVTATLTRQGLVITEDLPVSGSTASGTVDGLYAGEWVVRVDAAMADGTVIYTGQTTVMVVSGETREVLLTLNAAPGSLSITMDISLLLQQGKEVPGGKIGIYEDPGSGTATYKDMARSDTEATIHALVSGLAPRTYDAKVVIPAATNAIFTSEYFQFSILPGRTTEVFLDDNGHVNVGVIVVPEPGQVTGLNAMLDAGQVVLTWNPVAQATGYRIYRTDSAGRFKQLALVDGGGTTTFTDTHFAEAPPYDGKVRYAVSALSGAQEGLRSEPVAVAK